MEYKISGDAFLQLEDFLEKGYTNPSSFNECVYWERNLWRDLKYLSEWYYQNAISVGNSVYQIEMEDSKTTVIFNISRDIKGIVYLLILKFYFPILSENIQCKQLIELSEFHSWMKRLDEVKGARPTFWIEG